MSLLCQGLGLCRVGGAQAALPLLLATVVVASVIVPKVVVLAAIADVVVLILNVLHVESIRLI